MISPVLQSLLSALGAYLLWKCARLLFFRDTLDKIPGPPPQQLLFGNMRQIFGNPAAGEFHNYLVENYGHVSKLNGLFRRRMLYIYDPKALQHIFIKDQHTFEEAQAMVVATKFVFGEGLLSSTGEHHKRQRKMLNPVFSIAYLKRIIPGFFAVTNKLRDVLLKKTAGGPQEMDMVNWLSRTALEILSENALGYEFDSLTEDHQEHPYVTSVKGLGRVSRTPTVSIARMLLLPLLDRHKWIPRKLVRALVDISPWKSMQTICSIVDVMTATSEDIIAQAKRKVAEEGPSVSEDGKAKDLMSILIRENAKASKEDRLTDEEVLGQISTFVFAGMDTTSNALARIMDILANNQEAQDKLRAEIRAAKENVVGEPTYDDLAALPYMDAVIRETLRLYSPATAVMRETIKDTVLPLSKPLKQTDGKEVQELYLTKGTMVVVPISACNTSKEIWGPDAKEWKPARWMSPLPEAVAAARIPGVYSHLMTFIGGGRACIGFKFSEMEMKVVLFTLIDALHFVPSDKQIYWNDMGIVFPSTTREVKSLTPTLPLTVSRAA